VEAQGHRIAEKRGLTRKNWNISPGASSLGSAGVSPASHYCNREKLASGTLARSQDCAAKPISLQKSQIEPLFSGGEITDQTHMNPIFNAVAQTLYWIAAVTGFTYNEINIIVYYIILPFIYVALVDRILRKHILKIIYVVAWAGVLCIVKDFNAFSNTLFNGSVDFLLWFSHVGLNYVSASVVICVLLPMIVFVVLLLVAFPKLRAKLFVKNDKPTTA
jgi:hypothetical protein